MSAESGRHSLFVRTALWPAAILVWTIHRLLCATLQVEVLGRDRLERLTTGSPLIPCAWHRHLFLTGWFLQRVLKPLGFPVTYMVSKSRDGELASRVLRLQGGSVVRGSSSRGGLQAMRELQRAIRRKGACPVILPDGPKGPENVAKPGALVLAQISGASLLPLAVAVERAWRLSSWDRMFIPKPVSRVVVAVGEPNEVDRDLDDEGFEAERLGLERALNQLESAAQARLRAPRGD